MAKTKLYLGAMPLILHHLKYLLNDEEYIKKHIANLKAHRALSYSCGRALLKYALLKEGYINHGSLLPNIEYNQMGKPKIDLKDVYFNISHSEQLMALSLGRYNQGVDIEICNQKRLKASLIKRILSPLELECFSAQSSLLDQSLFFTRQWTLRECLVKSQGQSIFSMDKFTIDPYKMSIQAPGYPVGVIANFTVNIGDYFTVSDKICRLDRKISKQKLDWIEDKSFTFQVSVFLELCYQQYQSLEQAIEDNLEIFLLFIESNHNGSNNQVLFSPCKCSMQAIFTVN